MMLKIRDRNDILLLGTMDEVSCFTERWPFLVQFGWELHKRYQIWPLFFWLLALDKFNFTTETLVMVFKTVTYNLKANLDVVTLLWANLFSSWRFKYRFLLVVFYSTCSMLSICMLSIKKFNIPLSRFEKFLLN